MRDWDWDAMVEANRGKLMRLLLGLAALLGTAPTVRRAVRRRLLASLVPLESAVRRLALVMARDLAVALPPLRGTPVQKAGPKQASRGEAGAETPAPRPPPFALADRRRIPDPRPRTCPERLAPRILFLDEWTPRPRAPEPRDDDPVDAAALRRRLAAARGALEDLPAQALRLARWRARGERAFGAWRERRRGRAPRTCPLRTGRAPGHRSRRRRPAHDILADCHDLARHCLRMLERERYG